MRTPLQLEHAPLIPFHDKVANRQHRLVSSVYCVPLYHTGQVHFVLRHVLCHVDVEAPAREAGAIAVHVLHVYCDVEGGAQRCG